MDQYQKRRSGLGYRDNVTGLAKNYLQKFETWMHNRGDDTREDADQAFDKLNDGTVRQNPKKE